MYTKCLRSKYDMCSSDKKIKLPKLDVWSIPVEICSTVIASDYMKNWYDDSDLFYITLFYRQMSTI